MIGYYAHSHGSGHCNYAQLFAKLIRDKLTVFTDRDHNFSTNVRVVKLPNENPDGTQFDRCKYKEPTSLHYAPVNMRKITERNQLLLKSVIELNVNLLIVDVSVEVAMLARVSSIPYAYVRLQGNRNDAPHRFAFEGAIFLLAYFPVEMESEMTPEWVKRKTIYLGFISKYMFDSSPIPRPSEYSANGKPNLLYLNGFGGTKQIDLASVEELYNIYVVGPGRVRNLCSIGGYIGVVECARAFIAHADFIVAGCGSNTTSEILTMGKQFIAISEERPYDEQLTMANGLQKLGWAIALKNYSGLNDALHMLNHLNIDKRFHGNTFNLSVFCSILSSTNFRADRVFRKYEKFMKIGVESQSYDVNNILSNIAS